MTTLVYTYALIKSLYDQGKDYIDSFFPFALQVFPQNKFTDSFFIQRSIKDKFKLEVPIYVLETILARARRNGYIERKDKDYILTSAGIKYLDMLETDTDVERRIQSLVEDIRSFFEKKEKHLNSNEIQSLLIKFLKRNIEPLIEFINPSKASSDLIILKPDNSDVLLIEYIKNVEQQKPDLYKILQDMLFGSMVSVVLCVQDSTQIDKIVTGKFKNCKVYLDTNFVFFILGLYTEEFNEPARELFLLLKKFNFDIRIFSFTIDEICRVMRGYLIQSYRYPTTIGVETLYSSLKINGWGETEVINFITNIESILSSKGIKIEIVNIDIKNYKPTNEDMQISIAKCKPEQNLMSRNHDLAVMHEIIKLRGTPIRQIENSKALFLTADGRLSNCNFKEMGHRSNGTVSEVILDRVLANILWLKEPKTEPPLKSIIAIHSRDLFIKRSVWNKFYDVLHDLKNRNQVTDENISMLFYHKHIENVLREFNDNDVDMVNQKLVLEEIEKAASSFREKEIDPIAKAKDEEMRIKIQVKEREFLDSMKKEVSRLELEKKQVVIDLKLKISRKLKLSSGRKAKVISTIIIFIIGILSLVVLFKILYKIYIILEKRGHVNLIGLSLALFVLLFGEGCFIKSFRKIFNYLTAKLTEILYKNKLKEIEG